MPFTLIDIDRLKENPDNPRTITEAKFQALVDSVRKFPQMLELRPIVAKNADGGILEVLGGNMRLRACLEAGLKQVPVLMAENLTDDQIREFIIKDNVGYGEWDWEAIQANWPEAAEWGLDIPAWVNKGEVVDDGFEMPEEIQTDIVRGDLFEIGEHRLICGDSTSANDVAKVLNGKEPYLMVTDPPYGVKYDPTWRHRAGINDSGRVGSVSNDDRADWYDAWVLSPSSVAYVWHASLYTAVVMDSLERAGFDARNQIIWNKQQMVFGQGHYHWKHEPCWYVVKKGCAGNWAGDRKQTTMWDIENILQSSKKNKEDDAQFHGTQKPVECMARPIRNHDGDVYDPFLGSGTTMIAAQQLGRKCYGIEIDPKYLQVIVDRMRKFAPELQIKKNGVAL